MSEANDKTDKELAKLERKIAKLYRTAKKELQKEIESYFQTFEEADSKKREALEAGEITQEEYKQWRTRQMAAGVQFEDLRDRIAKRYLEVNEEALALVNESGLDIFALNHNYEAYRLESMMNG